MPSNEAILEKQAEIVEAVADNLDDDMNDIGITDVLADDVEPGVIRFETLGADHNDRWEVAIKHIERA